MMTPALEVKELTKHFGKVKALQGLTFSLPQGTRCAFVGANGAGKTTTFSLVGGFLRPTSGEIFVAGQQVASLQGATGQVGILPQDMRFFEERTLKSQLLLFAKLTGFVGKEAESEVTRVLESVSLQEKRDEPVRALSRGMRVRLGIAQALIGSPPLILLDEPMAGLDPVLRAQIRELLCSLGDHTTVVISSHELGELQSFCNFICVIDSGRALFVGEMEDLLHGKSSLTYTLGSVPEDLSELEKTSPSSSFLRKDNYTLVVQFTESTPSQMNKKVLPWLLENQISIEEVTYQKSLEEAYLSILDEKRLR